MDHQRIRRALISVSDKAGLIDFAQFLISSGVELLSTGGTRAHLLQAGLPVQEVAEETGFPEVMEGRLKTLHPKIHGGLLAKRHQPSHRQDLLDHQIKPIDLLIVNFYPFSESVKQQQGREHCVEQIDIGGPAMVRAGAKNHADVAVVMCPEDYPLLMETLKRQNGCLSFAQRSALAKKVYAYTAAYDAMISSWFDSQSPELEDEGFSLSPSPYHTLSGTLKQSLRYGENPHQHQAAYYQTLPVRSGIATATQLHGKELSYNNLLDADAAFEAVAELTRSQPGAVIVKHTNPCGAALGSSLEEAYVKALQSDPVSAFGGVVALNQTLDEHVARLITQLFMEVIIAPDVTPEALEVIRSMKNLRLLTTGGLPDPRDSRLCFRSVGGGFLVQERDARTVDEMEFRCVTKRRPSEGELEDLKFALQIVKHVKSNAIVYVKNNVTIGIGAAQMSRLDAACFAIKRAENAYAYHREKNTSLAALEQTTLSGSVAASDAFYPFPDALLVSAKAGITAFIQPGGSRRDQEVIEAADSAGVSMIFTGYRHFRH